MFVKRIKCAEFFFASCLFMSVGMRHNMCYVVKYFSLNLTDFSSCSLLNLYLLFLGGFICVYLKLKYSKYFLSSVGIYEDCYRFFFYFGWSTSRDAIIKSFQKKRIKTFNYFINFLKHNNSF